MQRRCVAFHFMNQVMADQRTASQSRGLQVVRPSLCQSSRLGTGLTGDDAGTPGPDWRPFPVGLHPDAARSADRSASPMRSGDIRRVELLFFPVAAARPRPTSASLPTRSPRRRRASSSGQRMVRWMVVMVWLCSCGTPAAADGAAVPACDRRMCVANLSVGKTRRHGERAVPHRIRVGTDVSPKRFEAEEQLRAANSTARIASRCCKSSDAPGAAHRFPRPSGETDAVTRRVYVHCGDDLAVAPSPGGAVREGLILTVDEEIYRLTPVFRHCHCRQSSRGWLAR